MDKLSNMLKSIKASRLDLPSMKREQEVLASVSSTVPSSAETCSILEETQELFKPPYLTLSSFHLFSEQFSMELVFTKYKKDLRRKVKLKLMLRIGMVPQL